MTCLLIVATINTSSHSMRNNSANLFLRQRLNNRPNLSVTFSRVRNRRSPATNLIWKLTPTHSYCNLPRLLIFYRRWEENLSKKQAPRNWYIISIYNVMTKNCWHPYNNLTLNVPCISENCIEIKIKLNFYFHTSLRCLKRFHEGLKGLHKTFWDTTKKCENKNST